MRGVYFPVAQHLMQFCKDGEFVIWRDAFRWKKLYYGWEEVVYDASQGGEVLSNHYDGMSLEQLEEDFGYEIDWDTNMHHVAIVRKK